VEKMSEYPPAWKYYRIKKLRKENNLTLAELAKKTNLAPNTISQYENGKRHPSIKATNKLASFFNVSSQYLLGYESTKIHQLSSIETIEKYLKEATFSENKLQDKKIKETLLSCFDLLNDELETQLGKIETLEDPNNDYDPYG
jgi:transcriptional regulator with XRE-family HTH domain